MEEVDDFVYKAANPDRWVKCNDYEIERKSYRRRRDSEVSSADHVTVPIMTVCVAL